MDTPKKYTDSEIIRYMKLNPELNIMQIANELEIPTLQVGQVQHSLMAKCLNAVRCSHLWNVPYYRIDPRSWLTKQQLKVALLRVENGEKGIYESLSKTYRISVDYKEQLLAGK